MRFKEYINESMFYMSPPMRERLKSLNNDISNDLLDVEATDVKPDMTFIDLDDNGFVSFTQINKAKKLFYKIYDEDNDDVWDDPDKLKSFINHLYDSSSTTIGTGIFTKGRNSIKIGKLINKIFPGKYSDKEIEEFVNLFKSENDIDDNIKFELVKGDDIAYWYDCDNYLDAKSTLGSSCMSNVSKSFFDIYTKNPDVVRLLILRDVNENLIIGRALVWKVNIEINIPGDVKYFMDRVYSNEDSDVNRFHLYAKKHKWARKTKNDYESHHEITLPNGEEYYVDMNVEVKGYDYNQYPYMDTFADYDVDGILYNNIDNDYGRYTLNGTEGTDFGGNGVWSEFYEVDIPEDEAIYSEHEESFIYLDRAAYVVSGSNTGVYPDSSNLITWDHRLDEYISNDSIVETEGGEEIFNETATYVIDSFDDDFEDSGDIVVHEDDYEDVYVRFYNLKGLEWFDLLNGIYDYESSSEDIYNLPNNVRSGISTDRLVKDYRDNWILEGDEIITIRINEDLWLTKEDSEMMNMKSKLRYKERSESRIEYINSLWIDSDDNPFDFIDKTKKEISDMNNIVSGKDLYEDDYKELLKNKIDLFNTTISELERDLENYFVDKLTNKKIGNIYKGSPSIKQVEDDMFKIRKKFITDWVDGKNKIGKSGFLEAFDYYNNGNEDISISDYKKSTIFNFLYIFPAIKNKTLTIGKSSFIEFGKKYIKNLDFKKDISIGYRLLKYNIESNRYNSTEVNTMLYSNYPEYKYLEMYR